MTTESRERHNSTDPLEPAPAAEPAPPRRLVVMRALALGAVGLVAAVLADAAIGRMGDVFKLPPALAALGLGGIPGPEDQKRIAAGNLVLQYKHSALWIGTAGALLGGLCGGTLGLFRGSRSSVARGLAIGAFLGGLGGCLAGPLAVYMDRMQHENLPPGQLVVTDQRLMLMHGLTWLVAGLACGLGVASGTRVRPGLAVAGTMIVSGVAGFLGGAVYPFVAGAILPLADASLPIPEAGWNRLLWLALPAVLIGLAVGRKGGGPD